MCTGSVHSQQFSSKFPEKYLIFPENQCLWDPHLLVSLSLAKHKCNIEANEI